MKYSNYYADRLGRAVRKVGFLRFSGNSVKIRKGVL